MNFAEELEKLLQTPSTQQAERLFWESDTVLSYAAMQKQIGKFDTRQKEMLYRLEEINENMQEQQADVAEPSEKPLVDALIAVADYVEDFYVFAAQDKNSPLFSQAEMIWHSVLKKISVAGLVRIYDEKTMLDTQCNQVAGTGTDTSLPAGTILRTLRSGYAYQQKVIRKSKVIVNKIH